MLYKNYHSMLVGRNFLSLIHSFELLKRGNRTLLLDDDRLQFGGLYTSQLGQLEVEFLKVWGEVNALKPLLNLDKYLVRKKYRFVLNGQHLVLGDSPLNNYRELLRKFPNFFAKDRNPQESLDVLCQRLDSTRHDSFNSSYEALCRQMSKMVFHQRDFANFPIQEFLSHYPDDLRVCYEKFLNSWEKGKDAGLSAGQEWRTFLYTMRAFFHNKFQLQSSQKDLFHLYLSLLGPIYELDEKALVDDLLQVFYDRGGSFKRTTIREWLFDHGNPWALELASFEGIVHPNSITFFGGHPSKMPVDLRSPLELYLGVNMEMIPKHKLPVSSPQTVVWADAKRIGSNIPLWMINFSSDRISLQTFLKREKGMKIDFYRETLKSEVVHILQEFFPGREDLLSMELESLSFNREIWTGGSKQQSKRDDNGVPVQLYDISTPLEEQELNNVEYFGPSKGGELGIYSTLMELRFGLDFY